MVRPDVRTQYYVFETASETNICLRLLAYKVSLDECTTYRTLFLSADSKFRNSYGHLERVRILNSTPIRNLFEMGTV